MNKPDNRDETPAGLREDLNAYSRVLENLIEGSALKNRTSASLIANFFRRRTLSVLDSFHPNTPTPPIHLINVKHELTPLELNGDDIIDEDCMIDSRLMEEKTPSVPVDFDLDESIPPDQIPTPNVFDQITPTIAETDEYARLIAMSAPPPGKIILDGAAPVYVDENHELVKERPNNTRPEVVFSFPEGQFTPAPEDMLEWSLSQAVLKLADGDTKPSASHEQDLDLDWSDL